MNHQYFMERAIALSRQGMESGVGGPFGCVIVRHGEIIAEGSNEISSTNDPTAHAEVVAIRRACQALKHFQLDGCIVYTSCEPCPMCMGAIYWARPQKVFFANTRKDAAYIGFDDDFIYKEIVLPPDDSRSIPFEHLHVPAALKVFQDWDAKEDKTMY
jgi:guanine deaminase